MLRPAVFLDRDGVINRYIYNAEFGTVDSPANTDEFALLPGVERAIAHLNRMGFLVVVVSNQPGIAKGRFSPGLLQAMTAKMQAEITKAGGRIHAVYYCLHHPDAAIADYRANCDCRKPRPGLVLRAAQEHGIRLTDSYIVGDGINDVLAGQAAGIKTVFISPRKCYVCDELARRGAHPDFVVGSLDEAVTVISSDQCRATAIQMPASDKKMRRR